MQGNSGKCALVLGGLLVPMWRELAKRARARRNAPIMA